ncbi:AsnC-type helix-turn-helix domain-containing protein [Salinimicrobium sediminis]|uniref:AsnC-type helix-turn-helix domain-containing protein n=1 Tax=Salinimicrobium sediminis TaxID=1343891 RepID=A0A285X3F7_9FLAO|nr:AsnC family protein [Salinimicrobium sediminis]SOC79845.1 AsnC-type helix-turn-helix domain-containing protein [Salinimicrobium sediminis]
MKSTSIEAHESIKQDKSRLHRKILQALRKINKGSFRDIAAAAGLRESQVWKRLSELKSSGSIQEVDTKKCPVTGRSVTVWTINQSNQLTLL